MLCRGAVRRLELFYGYARRRRINQSGGARGPLKISDQAPTCFAIWVGGDAANYAIGLGVAGMALTWRARGAAAKGGTLIAFALWVLGSTGWHAFYGTLPRAEVMGVIGVAALLANGGVGRNIRPRTTCL